jgi:hypothetical protein
VEAGFFKMRMDFEVSRMVYNCVHALDLPSIYKNLFAGSVGGTTSNAFSGFLSPFPMMGLL